MNKPPLPTSRRGREMTMQMQAFNRGIIEGVNQLAAKLQLPEGVQMTDGRTARLVYDAAPEVIVPPLLTDEIAP